MKALLILCSISLCLAAQSSSMFAGLTEISDSETYMGVAHIALNSGVISNFTVAEYFAGGSITVDGISALDTNRGIYYYASDSETPLLYAVDVIHNILLPPTDLYVYAIASITVNPSTSEAFVLAEDKKGNSFVLGVSYPPGSARLVLNVPSKIGAPSAGAFDNQKNFVLAVFGPTGIPGLAFINPSNGNISSVLELQCKNFFIFNLKYDANLAKFIAMGEATNASRLSYYYAIIDPSTGACSAHLIQSQSGIITCFSYDPNSNKVWYADAINNGNLLKSVNVVTNQQVDTYQTQYILENLEVDATS